MPNESITTAEQLQARGLAAYQIRQLLATGQLIRLQRGVYVEQLGPDASPEYRHRLLVRGRLGLMSSDVAVSHVSAAAVLGLPTWRHRLETVHVSRNRDYGGRIRSGLAVHVTCLDRTEVRVVDGVNVTTLARTVVDVARTCSRQQAIVVGDAALASGLTAAALDAALTRAKGWRGIIQARAIRSLLDGRSESPGESVSRLIIGDHGLPLPELQYCIRDESRRPIARVDFCWPQARVIGEYDGRQKYLRPFRAGDTVVDVVMAEKRREDAIRALGWHPIRWTTDDLNNPAALAGRIRRALDAGR